MQPFLSSQTRNAVATFNAPVIATDKSRSTALNHLTKSRAPGSGNGCTSPTIESVRDGDRVTRLIVTCSCGERIEIDCLYNG